MPCSRHSSWNPPAAVDDPGLSFSWVAYVGREGGRVYDFLAGYLYLYIYMFIITVIQHLLLSRGPSFGRVGAEDIAWGRVICVYG